MRPKKSPHIKMAALVSMAVLVIIAAGLACNYSAPADSPDPTLTALSASVAGTATAGAGEEGGSSEDLATARAEATQRSQEIEATRTVSATGRDEAQLATATVAAPVLAELPRYGINPSAGSLGWLHPPATIEIEGYHQYGFANEFQGVVARDFAMAADITWDTQYGASGCGFMFRSNGDQNKPDQYMLIITRLGNGHVIFSALAAGEIANVRDYYPGTDDQSFQAENGSTNRLAVVGRGYLFEIYTNGVKIGEVDATQPPVSPVLPAEPRPPLDQTDLAAVKQYQDRLKEYTDMADQVRSNYQIALQNYKKTQALFEEGFVGMIALSESGRTSCRFENAWLWLVE